MSNVEIGNWMEPISNIPILLENPDFLQIISDRLQGQYLPALNAANDDFAQKKVWLALWTYLTSRFTIRKPFQLTAAEADQVIDIIQSTIKYS